MAERGPTIESVRRERGVAGQYAMTAQVRYPGEGVQQVTFVANVHGGPIVMITPDRTQVFVSEDVIARLGRKVDRTWVEGFFSPPRRVA